MNEPWSVDPNVNSGSPVGPGFVVYERAPGQQGYDLALAKRSVGKGWHVLLEEVFAAMAFHKDKNPTLGWNDVEIIQVKEKYGSLRIYYSGGNNHVAGHIECLETLSAHFCEVCGMPGSLRTDRSWYLTLCDQCSAKPQEQLRNELSEQPVAENPSG